MFSWSRFAVLAAAERVADRSPRSLAAAFLGKRKLIGIGVRIRVDCRIS